MAKQKVQKIALFLLSSAFKLEDSRIMDLFRTANGFSLVYVLLQIAQPQLSCCFIALM